MSGTVSINGVVVDIDDPCAVARELKAAELLLATGQSVRVARFGEDEAQFTEANSAGLARLISRYESQCAKKQGKRSRGARSVVWR